MRTRMILRPLCLEPTSSDRSVKEQVTPPRPIPTTHRKATSVWMPRAAAHRMPNIAIIAVLAR